MSKIYNAYAETIITVRKRIPVLLVLIWVALIFSLVLFGLLGIGGLILGIVEALAGLLYFGFWLWTLIHALTNKSLNTGEKIVWFLVIFFLPLLGLLLYYFIGRGKG